MWTVYLDMDDTLADYSKRMNYLFKIPIIRENMDVEEFWSKLFEKDPEFFDNLEPFEHTNEFVDKLQSIPNIKVQILSSCGPPSSYVEYIQKQKISWLKKHIPSLADDPIFERIKDKYSKKNTILIDDNFNKAIVGFINKGEGMAFHLEYGKKPDFIISLVKQLARYY